MDYNSSIYRKKAWDGINYERRDAFVAGSVTAGGYAAPKTLKQHLTSLHRATMELADDISDEKAAIREYFAQQKAENLYLREHLTLEEQIIGILIRIGILFSAVILSFAIAYLIHPYTAEDIYSTGNDMAYTTYTTLHSPVDAYKEIKVRMEVVEAARNALMAQRMAEAEIKSLSDQHAYALAENLDELYTEKKNDLISGDTLPDILHYVYNDHNKIYDTAMGAMLYFCQGDSHWKDYLIAGADRMGGFGCGPVTIAMIANSFASTETPITPITVAEWAVENNEYAVHGGSFHSLIPDALTYYGLKCESVTERTPEKIHELLDTGHILIALMGKGSLTDVGHFVIITKNAPDGGVMIADPAKVTNSEKSWPAELIAKELKAAYDSGGPLWSVTW